MYFLSSPLLRIYELIWFDDYISPPSLPTQSIEYLLGNYLGRPQMAIFYGVDRTITDFVFDNQWKRNGHNIKYTFITFAGKCQLFFYLYIIRYVRRSKHFTSQDKIAHKCEFCDRILQYTIILSTFCNIDKRSIVQGYSQTDYY